MADTQDRTFGDSLKTWLQILGILVATGWGVWTFIYKEIRVPKSAPINITMNLQLKKVGVETSKESFVAVEMRISATNPSTRRVYLLPNMWRVYGYKLTHQDSIDEGKFSELAATTLNAHEGRYVERFASLELPTMLAAGELFTDTWLNPNEAVSRILIFHVPRRGYDLIDAEAHIPSVEVETGYGFKYSTENGALMGDLCRMGANAVCSPIEKNLYEGISHQIGYQHAHSESELSLWE